MPDQRGLGALKNLRVLTWQMAFVLATFYIATFAYGFDNVVYSTIQAMGPFLEQFGDVRKKGRPAISTLHEAYYNSLGLPAKAVGTVVGGLTANHFGRKPSFMCMQLVCLAGVAVSYTARSFTQMLVGRIFVQLFVGWDVLLVPMYTAELAPTKVRGALIGLFVFAHQFGSFVCSFVCYASSQQKHSNYSWQLPLATGFIFPDLVLLAVWFVPESPRWLVLHGRKEQAARNLSWLYGNSPEFNAEGEVVLLQASLEEDPATKGRWRELFKGRNKMRSFIAAGCGLFNQITGQSFVSQYGVVFVKGLHAMNPFVYSIISRVLSPLALIVVFFTIDILGRRALYMWLAVATTLALITDGALGVGEITKAKTDGILAMTLLFGVFYGCGYGAIGAIVTAKVPHLRLRDKTNIMVYVIHTVAEFLVTFTVPYLLNKNYANLGSKVGFIYGALALMGLVWAYFFLPETSNRSLEELEEIWRSGVPPRKFAEYQLDVNIGLTITENDAKAGKVWSTEAVERIASSAN